MELKLDSSYSVQTAYTFLHRLLLQLKLSHYKTRQYPAHEALGTVYGLVEGMIDDITEKLIGYSGSDPGDLPVGTIKAMGVAELADSIMRDAHKLMTFAESKEYCDIENLAQELSGAGAKLKYLSRF
jgi:hypothetical protein